MEGSHEKMKIGLSAISLILMLSLCSCKPKQPIGDEHREASFKKARLQAGDIVCRYGEGLWSRHFRDMSLRDKRFSHVGIVILESNHPFVIHASADDYSGHGQVDKELFSEFINDATDFAVYRIKGHGDIGTKIASNAMTYIRKPFDIHFDLSTKNEVYCSELVRLCVNSAAGDEVIGTSKIRGKNVVAIDDCYLHPSVFVVYDKTKIESG
jgi:uncharacterized protein YycO